MLELSRSRPEQNCCSYGLFLFGCESVELFGFPDIDHLVVEEFLHTIDDTFNGKADGKGDLFSGWGARQAVVGEICEGGVDELGLG